MSLKNLGERQIIFISALYSLRIKRTNLENTSHDELLLVFRPDVINKIFMKLCLKNIEN